MAELSPGDHKGSFISEFDPRFRILSAFSFAILVVSLFDFPSLLIALGFALLILLAARLPLADTLKKIVLMDSFVLFLVIMLPFTTKGDPVFHLFGYPLTQQGFEKAAIIALKTNAIVMMLLALVGSIKPSVLGAALHHLKLPQNLVHLILFSVRYIDVLRQEYHRLRTSMKTRCFRPRNTIHTYRSIGYLVGMMIIRSLERSERIMQAMKCRGFCGKFYVIDKFQATSRDYFGIVCFCMVAILIILVEVTHVPSY